MSKELHFTATSFKAKPEWVESMVFKLNNGMIMPMKILNFKLNQKAKKDGYFDQFIVVEECLDEKEWEKLCDLFRIGYNSHKVDHQLK